MGASNDTDTPRIQPSTLAVEMRYAISQARAVFNRKLTAAHYILENLELKHFQVPRAH